MLPWILGTSGTAKLSSSVGTALIPEEALVALEPSILRWIYARRAPNQRIVLNFGSEVVRLYDEMDALRIQVEGAKAPPVERRTYELATQAQGPLALTREPFPFRVLSAPTDVTQDNQEQMMNIIRQYANKPELSRRSESALVRYEKPDRALPRGV